MDEPGLLQSCCVLDGIMGQFAGGCGATLCKLECLAGILLHPEQVKVSLIDSLAFCSALYANQNEKCNTTRNIKFKRKMTSDTYKIKS